MLYIWFVGWLAWLVGLVDCFMGWGKEGGSQKHWRSTSKFRSFCKFVHNGGVSKGRVCGCGCWCW